MNHIFTSLLCAVFAATFSFCKKSPDTSPIPDRKTEDLLVVNTNITSNTTWKNDKKYLLKGNVFVEKGAELTIEPGTVILGDKAEKGALIISRGAKIHAKGTATKPIIFTSSVPKGLRSTGDWGGVVILGYAPNNQSADQTIEGISAAVGDNGKYGGNDPGDSSGEFCYVRIEFAGIALSQDNELNTLTFGSVGSGTEIHHVQASFGGDDSFEWFGGTVNTHHMISFRAYDDDLDTDFGYSGKNQYIAVIRDPNLADKSKSNGFESDNDGSGSANTPLTTAIFANVTSFGPYAATLDKPALNANYGRAGHIRRNSAQRIYNSAFVGWPNGVYFDRTNVAAVFSKNYFGRTLGMGAANGLVEEKKDAAYDDSAFSADNIIESDQTKVDLSDKFAALTSTLNLTNPNLMLSSGSSLLSGAVALPSESSGLLEQTNYIGAFDATNNWMSGWANFDPNNTDY